MEILYSIIMGLLHFLFFLFIDLLKQTMRKKNLGDNYKLRKIKLYSN